MVKPSVETKPCSKCKVVKPLSEFHNQKSTKTGLRSQCKVCTNEANLKKWHSCDKRKEQHKKASRKHFWRVRYGITPEQYEDMLEAQGGKCKICGSEEPWGLAKNPKIQKTVFCVDHNHETGEVRGLLCQPCNVGLGNFNDDPDRLMEAIKYLGGG